MIYILSSLYFLYGFVLFYSYIKGYSLLRYLLKRKNINVLLTIELISFIFIIFFIYSMINSNALDMDSLETSSAMIVIAYGIFVYISKLF